jgi:enediyne biosynthesis thioesterase
MRTYDLRHTVSFDETNVIGNVYFAHYVKWQGRCRELFLRDHARGVLDELANGLRLATLRCSCEYDEELAALDDVVIRMSLAGLGATSLTLHFDYYRVGAQGETRVARGEQVIACIRGSGASATAVPLPLELREALRPYEGRTE